MSGSRVRKETQRYEATIPERDGPRKKTVFSSKERRQQDAERRLEDGSPMERCRAVLDLMGLRQDAGWFATPVDTEMIPDYLEVIDTPNDYATTRQRLDAGAYGEDPIAFASDMRLIFTNAVKCVA